MLEKKNKGSTECDKSTITCDVGTALFENGTSNVRKKYEYNRMWQKYGQM